ncbi:MAG: DNA cytosine methyltransferase [Oscillospiraceae bacterium]|nr:DNA cytosine methyltransferase [Oscillospiraceae bacterium]
MAKLTHLSLFSGIGGLDIAAEWAGFRTVGQCEWADYPRAVLEKHWPGLPRWRDIRTLTKESFYEQTGLRTVTVLSGGFPCQPFSTAGKRRGKEDDRYLWPEMLRVIREIRPRWVVGENVAGIVTLALDTVLSDLESIGYACQAVIIPACAVDAPHRRDRCAILAYRMCDGSKTGSADSQRRQEGDAAEPIDGGAAVANSKSQRCGETGRSIKRPKERIAGSSAVLAYSNGGAVRHDSNNGRTSDREVYEAVNAGVFGRASETVPNTDSQRLQIPGHEPGFQAVQPENGTEFAGWWTAEPDVGRVAHGVPARVDRLRCLGNAVVPQWAYPYFEAIAQIERMEAIYEHQEVNH